MVLPSSLEASEGRHLDPMKTYLSLDLRTLILGNGEMVPCTPQWPVSPERKKQLGGAFPQAKGIFSCGAQRLVKNSFGQWERAPLQAARAPSTQQIVSAHSGARKGPHATAALGSGQGQPHLQSKP